MIAVADDIGRNGKLKFFPSFWSSLSESKLKLLEREKATAA